jgi:DNA/RNA-binding domain of Phe-tRNA-synthetase-like protein
MKFVVTPEIFELYPGLKLPVAVAEGVEAAADPAGVERLWRQAWEEAGQSAPNYANKAQSHPRVAAWRDAMAATGVSGRKFPSSVESLLKRAFKGGEPPRINPLVDFYNSVSLRHVVPAGGFDLAQLGNAALELRLTREGDTFRPLDSTSAERVEPGAVAYASGNDVLTRHFVWKQSHKGLLEESTSSVLLVCEVLGEVEESADGLAQAALEEFSEGVRRYFGAEAATFLVEERVPAASW